MLPPLLPRGARPFDVVAVGECSVDTICAVAVWPVPDSKQALRHVAELAGGQAATAAVACARLGWRTRYVGAMGDDAHGRIVRATLVREHVDAALVVRQGVPTRRAVVLVEPGTGRRAVLESRDVRLNVAAQEIDDDVLVSGRVLIVDATDAALARRAAAGARRAGVRTIVDVDAARDDTIDLLRLIDIVVVPAPFLRTVTGASDPGKGLRRLAREVPAAVVIVTLGEAGALALAAGREVRATGERVDVVDTTGAGDAFRAGLAASWLSAGAGAPELGRMLREACLVAALSCRARGAQTALPVRGEVNGLPVSDPGPM